MLKQAKNRSSSGFTLPELLVTMSLIGILTSLGYGHFKNAQVKSLDTTAKSDYRNIKLAITEAISNPDSPRRFIFRRRKGPGALPYPLQAAFLSKDVRATVVHVTRPRRNGRSRSVTRIDVYHQDGGVLYRYREVNGTIVEQEIDR